MPKPEVRIQWSFGLREVEIGYFPSPFSSPPSRRFVGFKRQTILSAQGGEEEKNIAQSFGLLMREVWNTSH